MPPNADPVVGVAAIQSLFEEFFEIPFADMSVDIRDVQASVVFLGVALLTKMDDEYVRSYWRESVVKPGATTVVAVHYDDFLKPLGEISLFPRILDDPAKSLDLLNAYAAESEPPVVIRAAEFGKPSLIY